MTTSSAFISYHHDDKIIGECLYDQLVFLAKQGLGRPNLDCFLDVRDIPPAEDWKPIIDTNLGDKDWLIVIFTGEQSVYCGYEIGTFSQLHAKSENRWIMGLFDVPVRTLPIILQSYQNTAVPSIGATQDPIKVFVSTDELNNWYESSIGLFLRKFCNYRGLYTVAHEGQNPGVFTANIAVAAKRIANAFAIARGTDLKSETSSQISFELTVRNTGSDTFDTIPGSSSVLGTSMFFHVLGLVLPFDPNQAPNTTWEELGRMLDRGGTKKIPWMHKVEADVVRAANNQTVAGDDVTFRSIQSGKVYRPVLVRHQLYMNGDRKFYLIMSETLDRRFVGSPRSSLLLTALIQASRWRFTYFENWNETVTRLFGEQLSITVLGDNCKQLFYNIEWIENEGAELGTGDLRAMIDVFGTDNRARVERFFSDWESAKKSLFAGLPGGIGIQVTLENRDSVRETVIQFLKSVKQQNADFLQLALDAYSEEIISDLGTERATSVGAEPRSSHEVQGLAGQ